MQIFNNADIIVGLHGAGFANLCFCKPSTKIIELKSNTAGKMIENMAAINNLTYKSISCEAIDEGSPDSKFTTPGGTPHRLIISISSITVPGVITSGLQITEQPAAKAVEIFLAAKTRGKFHGDKAATTPTGS